MSDDANDRKTLYSTLLSKNGNIELANALLETGNGASGYIVSFDYHAAGFTREQGLELLDSVLDSFRAYVETNYNYNKTIGSPVEVLDYREYDYSEAVTIFSDTLSAIDSYLSNVQSADDAEFRSQKTGYTFDELKEVTQMISDVELDQANAYIVLNSVTSDGGDVEIAHYQWRIDEIERQKKIEKTHLDALTASIAAYEKDPVVYALEGTVINSGEDYYDDLLTQKLKSQTIISEYDRTISYYKMLIKGYRGSGRADQAKCEQADRYLATLDEKVSSLIKDIRETTDEYYSNAVFNRTVNIQVPAIAEKPKFMGNNVIMCVGVAEAVLLVMYLGIAVVFGIRDSLSVSKKRKEF